LCGHLGIEMDLLENQFWATSRTCIICASHGALYDPQTGASMTPIAKKPLIKIDLLEENHKVFWQPTYQIKPYVCPI
ncbi:MAG: Rieske (2Fe-2S) protein, partial [Gammaproteobacteria bacterium]|nr:Rieske (2Fe-2S) protein [Gammaproteobacteria bacterium]